MRRKFPKSFFMLCALAFVVGCGGGQQKQQVAIVVVVVSPQSAVVTSGQTVQFTATVTGDTSGVVWSVNGVASGNSTVGTIDSSGKFTAPMVTQQATATVAATSKGDPTKSASSTVTINAPPVVAVAVSPQSVIIGAGAVTQFTATVTGPNSGVTWSVNGIAGGNATVGTIDSMGNYTAPAVAQNATATVAAASIVEPTKSAMGSVTIVAPGVVTPTANVQVAVYTITPPVSANVSIQFGPDTTYGLNTWEQPSPSGGGAVTILVAGMKLNSTYHMRAILKFADGSEFDDADQKFTTGTLPAASVPNVVATTSPGATPQSGVELLDLVGIAEPSLGAVVTDLGGNVLWTYNPPLPGSPQVNPIKLLANGHFLVGLSAQPDGTSSLIQEIDLSGQVIWQLTGAQLNQALATATCAGCNITIYGMHHDFAVLPNGHLIVIASENVVETGLTGFPNPVTVAGDVLIDLDQNHNPVWLWSSFDHLDLNRHPLNFPDWTHTNSVVYSPDDKALIISMRHQSWVLKIDYNDGRGAGDILWKLGYQGDFSLQNGTDPQDWFYAQHDANIISPTSKGIFQLLLFDDGNQRVLDSGGTTCGGTTTPPCTSRTPILQLDETAKTATIEWVDNAAPAYSMFGGSARLLQNGNVEFDECGLTLTGTNTFANQSAILEVMKTTTPQTVWQMQISGNYAYRAFRIPSLYPGVQW
jgi:arylsulfate sulfotransferase